ncbi:hypothetical protein TSUD_23860 [Trifolium subterraneum]|uniref:Uncharacterized protein n=1 Tax=Trifolium subterraneum TaxID=3900 RepID=A0A2Z6M0M5_TRISU|nr:hypothetical protein TSUD_23860 [Trifolium subterraneum]
MSSFPSSQERIVASAMLLLHTAPRLHSISNGVEVPYERRSSSSNRFSERSVSSESDKSSVSSSFLINAGDSSDKSEDEIKSTPVSFFSATRRYRQMKFKIARKMRSKVILTSSSGSGDRKLCSDATLKISPGSGSGEATSSLSTISSERSLRYANRSRCASTTENGIRREAPPPAKKQRVKAAVGTPHLRRRGEVILKLLRVDAVKRSGSGGRHDPFRYSV